MTSGREVERQIQAAIAEGSFDDLAGNGKPQDLTENSLEDPAQRMAFHVLKLGDVTPDWVQLGNEIERADDAIQKDIEGHHRQMQKSREQFLADPAPDLRGHLRALHRRHRRARAQFRLRLIELRGNIERFNHLAPDPAAKVAIQVEPALASIDRAWPWPEPRG
jgi:hypothetical protein